MIGTTIAQYEVLEKLGSGGMGVVYKAKDLKLDRFVALKFLPQDLETTRSDKQRFIREARAASALDHPNICTVYDINQTPDRQMYIAMAYYEGVTLKQKIATGPLPISEVVDYALQVARGLSKAHSQGIIHRDIKPANIMITTEGVAKILDFGLAKSSNMALTRPGTIMGTVAYMSPEQTQSQALDHRTDIWSFGVLLYEMLTAHSPFKGANEAATIYAIVYKEPPPVTELRAEIPAWLENLVVHCLAKKPEDRPAAMEAIIDTLQARGEEAAPGAPAADELGETLSYVQPLGQPVQRRPAKPVARAASEQPQARQKKPPATQKAQPEPGRSPRLPLSWLPALAALALAAFFFQDLRREIANFLTGSPRARLSVVSAPAQATVFVDGDSIGRTPLQQMALPGGSHRLQVKHSGIVVLDTMLQLRDGEETRLSLALAAERSAAGEHHRKASDTMAASSTPAGSDEPAARMERDVSGQVIGQEVEPAGRPAARPATLIAQAIPEGSVRVRGRSGFEPAATGARFTLTGGRYTIEFSHPLYGRRDTTLVLPEGGRLSLRCYFVHSLSVQSLNTAENPVWASVVIDGRHIDRTTPLADYALEPGEHEVSVERRGYRVLTAPQTIRVRPEFREIKHRLVFYIQVGQ